ncbi:MAG: hypothetical protein AVDCRST_MAG05-3330 [uncultured Rubrobacteraceae bacterium]|uniref:Uncharacterized protein n=1 Tax=uncultured Rubrobacteraceae bacterium TaxID=349277 RepID=A0A6J4T836_9ACTN|nr:MAG: hypothetical protein AVDCRST_MAG05-3330 [uncultured Rubrobacteraceae bacterium]
MRSSPEGAIAPCFILLLPIRRRDLAYGRPTPVIGKRDPAFGEVPRERRIGTRL